MKWLFAWGIFTIIITPLTVFSQNGPAENGVRLAGVIVDQDDQQPLAYASIGVLNKPAGTVSDSLGHFQLAIGREYQDDTLQVSMVGFYPVRRSIRELSKETGPIIIKLIKRLIRLNEVVVSDQFQHMVIIGRQSNGSLIQVSLIPKNAGAPTIGAESGLKIHAGRYPALLENLNFYVSANNFKLIKFRVNIYALKHNLPDTLMVDKEILVSLDNYKTGWTQIDLAPYHIVVKRDFAVTLQWVDFNKDMIKAPQVLIPAGISFSQTSYFRLAGQDKWKSMKGIVSLYMTLKN